MIKSTIFRALVLCTVLLPFASTAMNNNSSSSYSRQLKRPLAFLCGAAALGGVVYGGSATLEPNQLAASTVLGAFIGGVTGLSYCSSEERKEDANQPPRVYKGSLLASMGYAATTALVGFTACKISGGSYSSAFFAWFSGWIVGSSMYYAQ